MRVVQISFDFDSYQHLNIRDTLPNDILNGLMYGSPLILVGWRPIDTYPIDPELTRGAFCWMSCPIVGPRAIASIGWYLKRFGELLPITIEGDEGYAIWNITCVRPDLVDLDNSRYMVLNGVRSETIAQPAFFPDLISEPIAFRIPQHPGRLYVATDMEMNQTDFVHLCIDQELHGLIFEEKWSSDV